MKSKITVLFLLLGMVTAFVGCQKDDGINQPEKTAIEAQSLFTILKVDKVIISQNRTLAEKLNDLEKKLKEKKGNIQERTTYSSEYDFYIESNYATYIENQDGTYHSYTFPIWRPEDNDLIENLIFSLQDDGTYKIILIAYPPDAAEPIALEILEDSDLSNGLFGRYTMNCIQIVEEKCGAGNATHQGGYYPNRQQCPAYSANVTSECIGGSGNDPNNPGGNPQTGDGNDPDNNCTNCGSNGNNGDPNHNNTSPDDVTSQTNPDSPAFLRGKFFKLNQLTSEQRDLFLELSDDNQGAIIYYLEAAFLGDDTVTDGYPQDAVDFAVLAIHALQDNDGDNEPDGEVDYVNEIIFESSITELPCQKEIIEDMMRVCGSLSELFQDIFINSNEAQLTVKAVPMPSLDGGFTTYAGANDNGILFETTLNTYRLTNSTDLDIITTLVHEYTHAILMYFFYASPQFNIDLNNPPSYGTLAEQFSLHRKLIDNSSQSHHDYMAILVDDIAQVCYNWCQQNNVNADLEYLNKISWGGLTDTFSFDFFYPESNPQRMEILNAQRSEIFPNVAGENPQGTLPCD